METALRTSGFFAASKIARAAETEKAPADDADEDPRRHIGITF